MAKDKSIIIKSETKVRNSNLELFRIITMLLIIAHHYVVNSGLIDLVYESNIPNVNDIFLLLFGWGGKTGINCFVLITGYFMCSSHITTKKFIKLISERYFYYIGIFLLFLLFGYSAFSLKDFAKTVFPFFNVTTGFTSCYLLFYLFIPFLNKIIKSMNEKEHLSLVVLLLLIYTILPSFLKATVSFNYITWFIVIYFIASYIKLYPKECYNKTKLWAMLTIFFVGLSWLSVIVIYIFGRRFGIQDQAYFFVADSNKILALLTALSSFMLFKNLEIKQNKFINVLATSTFGVLLIHANSDTMRHWLWKDVLKNVEVYNTNLIMLHAILSVFVIFFICSFIDLLRIRLIEKPFLNKLSSRFKWID